MNVIAIYGSRHQQDNQVALRRFFDIISAKTDRICINAGFARHLAELNINPGLNAVTVDKFPPDADILVSIGGDGTFLKATAWAQGASTPIIGLNTGHLGFLANYSLDEVDLLADVIFSGSFPVEPRLALQVSCDSLPSDFWPYALNEVAILKSISTSMVTVRVRVNERFIADYKADGLVISTPTGSTAYNLSAGGPILAPDLDCIVISPIAPHSLTARPLVIGAAKKLDLEVFSRRGECHMAIDGRSFALPCQDPHLLDSIYSDPLGYDYTPDLSICAAPFPINIVRRPDSDFASILRHKLLWSEH